MDENLELAREIWNLASEKQRRLETQELYSIFSQDWKALLIKHLRTIYSEQLVEQLYAKANTSLNLFLWVVNELSQIYVKKPERFLKGETEREDLINWYENKGKLDLALDRACRLCFGLREVVLRPHVSQEGVTVEVILPHLVSVLHEDHDLTKIKMLVIQHKPFVRHIWTKDYLYICDLSFQLQKKIPNQFGVIPFVVAHAAYPTTDFWHHNESNGLKDLTLSVATGLTDHAHLRHLQSFKQVWLKSDETAENIQQIVMDPSSILPLRGNAAVGTLDLTTDLTKHLDSSLAEAEAGVALYGLRSEQLRGKMEAQSGFALSLKMQNQIKVWERQRRLWKVWENELFSLCYQLFFYKKPQVELEINFDPIIEIENV